MPQSNDKTVSKGATLFVAAASNFLTPFMSTSVNIALPNIGNEFGLDAILLNWVATAYLLAASMFLIPLGRIADIYGRRKIFIFGMVIYTLSPLILAFSSSIVMIITLRFIQGIGAAMIFGTGMAIVASVFPQHERGKAIGIIAACVYTGTAVGPVIGGLLTHYVGWRSIFLIIVPVSLVVTIIALWKIKGEWKEAKGEGFDYIGSIIYSLALLLIIYGFSLLPGGPGSVIIVIGIIATSIFIWWERRFGAPLLNLALFKGNPGFAFSNMAAFINYSATFAVSFLLSLYLQYIKGFTADYAGIILISQAVIQVIISPFAGRLSDSVEPRRVASTGMAITTVGLIMLIFLSKDTAVEYIVLSLIILGIGFGLFTSPNTNAAISSVDNKSYGVASGTVSTMRVLGQVLSMGIAMVVFAIFMGRVQITPEYYPQFMVSVNTAFIIFAALCFGGIFASLARGNIQARKQ